MVKIELENVYVPLILGNTHKCWSNRHLKTLLKNRTHNDIISEIISIYVFTILYTYILVAKRKILL